MTTSPTRFAELLRDGLWMIRRTSGRKISDIQDEMGYTLGRNGASWVEWLRKGNLPPTLQDIEQLAIFFVQNGDISEEWCYEFLVAGGHPYADNALQNIFSDTKSLEDLYDAFICCDQVHRHKAESLAQGLLSLGLNPYVDKWNLESEDPWNPAIEYILAQCKSCVLLIGENRSGPWEHAQFRTVIERVSRGQTLHIVSVLLPSTEPLDRGRLPGCIRDGIWLQMTGPVFDEQQVLQYFVQVLSGDPPSTLMESDICPYRGLLSFREEHAQFYFGRDAAIQWLLNELEFSRFFAILGSSGSGKSSLIHAGLIPSLREQAQENEALRYIEAIQPGERPLEELALLMRRLQPDDQRLSLKDQIEALLANEKSLHLLAGELGSTSDTPCDLIIVVDQFEELFTLCEDYRERQAFLDNLLFASSVERGHVYWVIAMRADFYHRCAEFTDLAARITGYQLLVGEMSKTELQKAIELPAKAVGLTIEPGLTQLLLRDALSQPGSLPLLQHALMELWERRQDGQLQVAAYSDIEGLSGSIARRAEEIFRQLSVSEKLLAKEVFLELVQPGIESEDTKRRELLETLLAGTDQPEELRHVIDVLIAGRLLVASDSAGGTTIELAHEALIKRWSRLARWLDSYRESLQTRRWLTERAIEWDHENRDSDILLRGIQLARVRALVDDQRIRLNPLENEYLKKSRQRQGKLRIGRVFAAVAGMLVVTIIVANAAMWISRTMSNWRSVPAVRFAAVTAISDLAEGRICVGTADEGVHCRMMEDTQWEPMKLGLPSGPVSGFTGDSVGRVDHLKIDPVHPDTYYAGVLDGGIFKTTATLKQWQRIDVPYTQILELAVYDQTVFAVFATSNNRHILFGSPDGGNCWDDLRQTAECWSDSGEQLSNLPQVINDIYIDQNNLLVFFGTEDGLWQMRIAPPWSLERIIPELSESIVHVFPHPPKNGSLFLVSESLQTGQTSVLIWHGRSTTVKQLVVFDERPIAVTVNPDVDAEDQIFALFFDGEVIAVNTDGDQRTLGRRPDWIWNSVPYTIKAFQLPESGEKAQLWLGHFDGLFEYAGVVD